MYTGRSLWFPNGSKKAVTVSYDDGVIFDVKLCEILAKYKVKGTFNINSGMENEPNRMSIKSCVELYKRTGQEVGYHGVNHIHYLNASSSQTVLDVSLDRRNLEKATNGFIIGGAYPYGAYNEDVKKALQLSGIKYSRTTKSTKKFNIPTDFLEWHPTCHHKDKDLFPLLDEFLNKKNYFAEVFYLWGHSYEFNNDDNWNIIEEFCQNVSDKKVWFATNGEIYRYVNAYNSLEFSADESFVYNPTQIDVYFNDFEINSPIKVPAGKTIKFPSGEVIE